MRTNELLQNGWVGILIAGMHKEAGSNERLAKLRLVNYMLGIMTCVCIFLLLVCIVGCQQAPRHETVVAPDPKLQRLKASLYAAETQTDMNLASKKISEFWDGKLASVEKRVEQKLDGEERKRFSQSKERWHTYRMQEVEFVADFFDGGSIQPLITNERYSDITEHRVAELESLLAVALDGRESKQ